MFYSSVSVRLGKRKEPAILHAILHLQDVRWHMFREHELHRICLSPCHILSRDMNTEDPDAHELQTGK